MKEKIVTRTRADRIRYVVIFELLLITILAPTGAFILNKDLFDVGQLSVVLSLKAMAFAYFYNLLFDHLDLRAGRMPTKRSLPGRVFHALGFELGLMLTSLPIVVWWLGLSIVEALVMDLMITSFVVVYTFLFSLSYDRLFPIHSSNCDSASRL